MRITVLFFGHSSAGDIARNLMKKYKIAKYAVRPTGADALKTAHTYWLTFDASPIMKGNRGIGKKFRLETKMQQWEKNPPNSLYDLFMDILYIETKISATKNPWLIRIYGDVFVDEALKQGIDFREEHREKMLLLHRPGLLRNKGAKLRDKLQKQGRGGVFRMDNNSDMKCFVEPEKPFYKKIPLIPALILLVLIGAWIFRWDYKATQTTQNHKVIHKIDRWTGDRWQEIYGVYGSFEEGDDDSRDNATVVWCIAFASTAGVIAYKVRRDN